MKGFPLTIKSLQDIDDVDTQLVDVVSSLHDKKRRALQIRNQFTDAEEIIRFQFEKADRVFLKSIHSQGHHHHFSPKLIYLC